MPEFNPTVALVDFRLGNVTGFEVAQMLRKLDEDLPVILMTAYPSLDLAVKAIQSDIYDFISKPVDKTYLLRSINKAAEKRFLTEENRKLIASLKASNATLERLNRMKSKFLSIVTHYLRTPLTSIRGYSEILHTEESLSAENREKCFDAIEKSLARMNALINNLMDMVSIEAGKLRIERQPIDLVDVCQETKVALTPVAESKKVALEWDLSHASVKVLGDSNRIVQVMTNLISNAFKHTAEGGKIIVRLSEIPHSRSSQTKREMALVEIIDNGEGISVENQQKIFEQFFQVDSPTKREGLGLGLAISKEIIHAHEGEIGVLSEGIGSGSKFWFTIPLSL